MATKVQLPGIGTTAKGVTLVLAQILPVMAVVSLFPAIPRLMQHFSDVENAAFLIPMILTVPSLMIALLSPMAGSLADRFGRRPIFVGALALYSVAGLVPLVVDDLRLIIFSRILLGIAEGGIITVSTTLIGDYFEKDRFRWVTWVGIAISVAGTLLVGVGGYLADISWRGPFSIYIFALPVFVLAYIVIDEPAGRGTAEPGHQTLPFPWKTAPIIGAVTFIASVLYYLEPLHIATMLMDRGVKTATDVGLIQASTSIAYILGAIVYRRLEGWSFGKHIGLAGFLIGVGLAIIALSRVPAIAIGGAAVQQFGSGFVIPALMAWGQSRLPLEQRGRGMGIWATAFFLGAFVCPPFVTVLAGFWGLSGTILALGLVCIVLALIAPLLFPLPDSSPSSEMQ